MSVRMPDRPHLARKPAVSALALLNASPFFISNIKSLDLSKSQPKWFLYVLLAQQMKPSILMEQMKGDESEFEIEQTRNEAGKCPDGTVPILRTRKAVGFPTRRHMQSADRNFNFKNEQQEVKFHLSYYQNVQVSFSRQGSSKFGSEVASPWTVSFFWVTKIWGGKKCIWKDALSKFPL